MRVLVTRPREQATEFCDALVARGVEPVCMPTITIGPPPDWSACDAALAHLPDYDALLFTSAGAVRAFVERMAQQGHNCEELPAGFGVGRRTKTVMADCGLTVVRVPDAPTAAALAGEICTFLTGAGYDGIDKMRFLFPCGDKARAELPDALRTHGAIVEPVVVYSNTPADPSNVERVHALLAEDGIACVTFFSPSAVDAFLTLLPDFRATLRARTLLAAIGDTTAAAIRACGMEPDLISARPDSAHFAAAIAERLQRR